jgi:hypothetical protein
MMVPQLKETVSQFSSIDDLLGDSRTRFFGAGFRLVQHEVIDVQLDPSTNTARASAKLEYPASWSTKKSKELQPHLSTLDAFIIGAQLCEAYVRTAYGIEGEAADRLWVARSSLRPSNTPTTDLSAVAAGCKLVKTESSPRSICGNLSSFTVQVGSIGLEFVIDHPISVASKAQVQWANINDLLGPPEERYFGSAYMATQLVLRDINFDANGERVQALLDLEDPPGLPKLRGMGAAYFPFVSHANVIVGVAQLAQALLYRHDNVSRDSSHNLWMRKVVLDSPFPESARRGLLAETWSTKLTLLPIKDTTWRSGSFVLVVPGVVGEYNLAHQLPAAQAQATKAAQATARTDTLSCVSTDNEKEGPR